MFEPIVTRITIPLCYGEHRTLYNKEMVHLEIRDEAAGPYLAIHGENLDITEDESPDEFYLCTDKEIDTFCKICKDMLNKAKEAAKTKVE
jgi:hypothetical protein